MSAKYEALRGMEDILPGEVEKWQWLEEKARIYFGSQGFREIRTPIIEYTDLFVRSVGESSDIVNKEMFSFEDRGGRNVTMRPEMTASVARCVIEKGLLSQAKHLMFYYMGPMFRAERPQAGRKRQFHQIGVELINVESGMGDLLCIESLYGFLTWIGLKNIQFKINDLGSAEQQQNIASSLKDYFSGKESALCKDCHYRLTKNVLRVLDCKNESCQPIIDAAPWDNISPLSESFLGLTENLSKYKIPYKIHRRLVRGLDYYNGVVFEVTAQGLGAQDALAGGGRYDRLYGQLGGKPALCTGFSIGFERLLLASQGEKFTYNENSIYLVPLVDPKHESASAILNTTTDLRAKLNALRFSVIKGEANTKLGDQLKHASKIGAGFAIIVGPDEYQKKVWTVKNLNTGQQVSVKDGELFFHLKGMNPL